MHDTEENYQDHHRSVCTTQFLLLHLDKHNLYLSSYIIPELAGPVFPKFVNL